MTKPTKLFVTAPDRPGREACVVHIYPTGPGMGSCYLLNDTPSVIGRDPDCEIRINDKSVSRRHARIQPEGDGFAIMDLQSTNGTLVNEVRVTAQKLKDGDYLHIGNAIYRFLAGGNVEAAYHEEIYRLTIIDALTGIHNKRYFLEFLEHELSRSARYRRPLSLILIDLDKFKSINDRLGHLAGDHALHELAGNIQEAVRKEDLFARYGGEEFALVMPETPTRKAVQMAERLRKLVEQHSFAFEGQAFPVTISLGVVTTSGDELMTVHKLIQQTDAKLYQAKNEGRNRVVS